MKTITIAIVGCGSRGLDTYANCEERFGGRMKIVAAADPRPEKLAQMKAAHGLEDAQCYDSAEAMFGAGRLADAVLICSPDHLHYKHAMAALALDYHLLLEKPIAPTMQECLDIQALAEQKGRHVIVCHVLRYTVFYQKLYELIRAGAVGEVVTVQAIEQVGHWHQAHSFVRGNWRSKEGSAPMILAKCCHDMDILLWLTGKRCKRVSSFGSLRHFRPEFAPQGAPMRCTDGCPAADTCPYNAVRFYMGKLQAGDLGWPVNILTVKPDEEHLMEALKNGPYGRCVYHCDNDVVDHQIVNLELEDGVTVSFTMSAFTNKCKRQILIMGTHGEISADMGENIIRVTPFVGEETVIDVESLAEDFTGHGGGDARLMREFLDLLSGESEGSASLSSISRSVESHLVALAAEESMLANGMPVELG